MVWPDLTEILGEIRWAVAGAVATRLYMPERATKDLDIVVMPAERERVETRLRAANWSINILEGSESWRAQAISEAQTNRDAQGLPILPFAPLVLMKFRASRSIDVGDLTQMLGLADAANLAQVREFFARWEPDGLDDLESLIELGQWELQGDL